MYRRKGTGISLIADYEFGEGNIKLNDRFLESSRLMQIDLLKDWIYDLEKEYEKRRKAYWESFSSENTLAKRRSTFPVHQ